MGGRRDFLCHSMIPLQITDMMWDPWNRSKSEEFVTISDYKYHYWKIDRDLQFMYQEGHMPKGCSAAQLRDQGKKMTALTFVEPMEMQNSIYMLIGFNDGSIWVEDTRANFTCNTT